jgi:hypothetical protein
MNFARLVFPFIAGADFYRGTNMLQRSDDTFAYLSNSVDTRMLKRMIHCAFASPQLILAIDMWRFFA